MGAKIDNSWQRRTFSRTETFIRAGKVGRVFWAGYRICFSIMLKTRIEVSRKTAITAGLRSACQAGEKVREIKEDIFHIIPSKELFTYLRQKWKQELQRSSKYLPKIGVKTPKGRLETLHEYVTRFYVKALKPGAGVNHYHYHWSRPYSGDWNY